MRNFTLFVSEMTLNLVFTFTFLHLSHAIFNTSMSYIQETCTAQTYLIYTLLQFQNDRPYGLYKSAFFNLL